MMPRDATSLREVLIEAPERQNQFLWAHNGSACLHDLARGSRLGGCLSELSGRSVVLATRDQLVTALALIELDGTARRLTLCPPDLSLEQLLSVAKDADADAIVSDCAQPDESIRNWTSVELHSDRILNSDDPHGRYLTEWVLLTSGTSSQPKLVLHSLSSLSAAIANHAGQIHPMVWGTFYNICRYGGLQILLRTVLGGASLVLSSIEESSGNYLVRLSQHRVTHLLGTPTHWRRALMSPRARDIAPQYVRLSGEIADQSILNTLRSFYPNAVIAHAFASTEAGVAFTVNDGREGFPASLLNDGGGAVELKVEHGSLHVCSAGTAVRYLGSGGLELRDQQNFVDTGDAVELRDGRYHFLGRVSGVINVGGSKVHPEEVETVINQHPRVEVALVRAKKNPIMGSIVVADIVLKKHDRQQSTADEEAAVKLEISKMCRAALATYKIPVTINIVPALAIGATGKVIRHG
jgi:acyl-coenzyme A synthetase/AMP-(fatty) acid ligase